MRLLTLDDGHEGTIYRNPGPGTFSLLVYIHKDAIVDAEFNSLAACRMQLRTSSSRLDLRGCDAYPLIYKGSSGLISGLSHIVFRDDFLKGEVVWMNAALCVW